MKVNVWRELTFVLLIVPKQFNVGMHLDVYESI